MRHTPYKTVLIEFKTKLLAIKNWSQFMSFIISAKVLVCPWIIKAYGVFDSLCYFSYTWLNTNCILFRTDDGEIAIGIFKNTWYLFYSLIVGWADIHNSFRSSKSSPKSGTCSVNIVCSVCSELYINYTSLQCFQFSFNLI